MVMMVWEGSAYAFEHTQVLQAMKILYALNFNAKI
jgi:hypothetical protein